MRVYHFLVKTVNNVEMSVYVLARTLSDARTIVDSFNFFKTAALVRDVSDSITQDQVNDIFQEMADHIYVA